MASLTLSHKCDDCETLHRFIHNVYFECQLHRFCTSCTLKHFPQSFCAICFRILNPFPPPQHRAMCLSCHSISHLSCCDTDRSLTHRCPHCKNPNKNLYEVEFGGNGDEIGLECAEKILTAAWIAAESMKKAEIVAREEAVKKVREVVDARRDAKEALVKVSSVCNDDGESDGEDQEGGGSARGCGVGEDSGRGNACLNLRSFE